MSSTTVVANLADQMVPQALFYEKVYNSTYTLREHMNNVDVSEYDITIGELLFKEINPSIKFISWLVKYGDSYGYVYVTQNNTISIEICSQTEEEGRELLEKLKDGLEKKEVVDEKVPISFWVNSAQGPKKIYREIEAPAWTHIEQNYTKEVRAAFERVVEMINDETAGRIIIWHGDPGAGKTYAIRALMNSLRENAEFNYVIDPESFFGHSPAYMLDVLLSGDDEEDMRLFILEDTGELLQPNASETMGQGLSRLLNFADGMIGQGMNARIIITTNEQLNTLHPAVTRHGRCLSVVEFEALPTAQANEWLEHNKVNASVAKPTMLSDLYAMKGEYEHDGEKEEFRPGVYV